MYCLSNNEEKETIKLNHHLQLKQVQSTTIRSHAGPKTLFFFKCEITLFKEKYYKTEDISASPAL